MEERLALPQGMIADEALLFLTTFARLKERRFGRLTVTVSEGQIVGIELVEKLDRNLFRTFPARARGQST